MRDYLSNESLVFHRMQGRGFTALLGGGFILIGVLTQLTMPELISAIQHYPISNLALTVACGEDKYLPVVVNFCIST